MSIRHYRNPGVCVFVSAHFPVCVSAGMCIWFVSRNTSSGALRCKSAQEGKCVYTSADACSPRCFQAPWMTFFSSVSFSLSGRSWEELSKPQSHKPKGQNETRCDKLLNPCHSVLHPFCLSLFCFRSPLAEKKTPSSYPAFTILVNPSQLQSVMIRSLINATGKERS